MTITGYTHNGVNTALNDYGNHSKPYCIPGFLEAIIIWRWDCIWSETIEKLPERVATRIMKNRNLKTLERG